jgi:predicted amidohydrolase YtcJ
VHLLGSTTCHNPEVGITTGPRKLLLRDHELPHLDALTAAIAAAHRAARPVAVHCVSRESLLLTLAALQGTGTVTGDRIEHAAVVPPESRALLAQLGLRVVTQPSFVADRGDDYLADVASADHELLYPCRSLLSAGVPVAPSSDAPFGDLDPWHTIAAATSRRTTSGAPLGVGERVDARTVLAGYLCPANDPGGAPRRVAPGRPADLCLLAEPLTPALAHPSADLVAAVIRTGAIVYRR